ncbi:MAG: STAS domain-containing protein [Planctomycetes bacterium]|nr:STAS domain-containing protein [Planctomycetota bacterium]
MAGFAETRILESRALDFPDAWFMKLHGALDGGETLGAFEQEARTRVEQGCRWMVLDVAKVGSYADLGYGLVTVLNDALEKNGGKLLFAGMPKRVHATFELLKMDDRFVFAADLKTALDRMRELKQLADNGRVLLCVSHARREPDDKWKSDPLQLTAYAMPDLPGHLLVEMSGALNATNVIWYESWLKQREEEGYIDYIWDLHQTRYLSSTGEGSFLMRADLAERHGRRWAVCHAHPKLTAIFDMLGFGSLFDMYPTVEAALETMTAAPAGSVPERPVPPIAEAPVPGQLDVAVHVRGATAEAALSGAVTEAQVAGFDTRLNLACSPLSRYLLLDVSNLAALDEGAEAWLLAWAGKMIQRGGCVALAGLSDSLAGQLKAHDCYSAFEHYELLEGALNSLRAVVAKEPAWVRHVHRFHHLQAAVAELAKNLGSDAEKQLKRYLDDFLALEWLRYLVLDAGETETLAPEVELQITHAAEMLKRRGGLLAIAGASPGLRDSLGKGGGDRVYSYFASPQGALEFIDDEFTAMS